MTIPMPHNEAERLDALKRYNIMDTLPEEAFDRITRLVARQLNVQFALISLLDEERQWFKSRVGLDVSETPRELAFCAYTIMQDEPFIVEDATNHPTFQNNPLVTGEPNVRFYAGVPLRTPDGYNLGTLCAIDTKARKISADELKSLADLAHIVVDALEHRRSTQQQLTTAFDAHYQAEQKLEARSTELQESEQRYRNLVESGPVAVVIVSEGVIKFANQAATRLLRWPTAEALVGQPQSTYIHPRYLKVAQSRFLDAVATSSSLVPMEQTYLTADGGELQVEATGTPTTYEGKDAVMSVFWDLTIQKQAMEELRQSEAKFKAVVDNASSAIYLKDLQGRFILVNKQYSDWFGPKNEEIVGKTFQEIYPEIATQDMEIPDDHVIRTNAKVEWEILFPHRDGSIRDTYITKVPVCDDNGDAVAILGIVTDVSNVKQTERRLQQVQKMETVGQLTGGVAHDFNNLLAVIQGNAELLLDGVGDQKSKLDAIARASMRGAELTQRLLAYSRQQPLSPTTIDVSILVSEFNAMLTRTLGEAIEINISMQPDLWNAVADPGQVENALLNLAINARDAMADGGILTISCSNEIVDERNVAAAPDAVAGEYVMIVVNDTGCGMSDYIAEHAFEPFFTTKDVGKGSGLGLSMIYGFAKQSNGHVMIESKENEGTTVRLYLPRTHSKNEAEPAADERALPRSDGELIFVIEDDADVRNLVVAMLKSQGYHVVAAENAISAFDTLARYEPDIMLCDVVLPGGMSGPEFVAEVRQKYPNIKTVYMSGYSWEAATKHGSIGADEILLSKPFEKHHLIEAIQHVLSN